MTFWRVVAIWYALGLLIIAANSAGCWLREPALSFGVPLAPPPAWIARPYHGSIAVIRKPLLEVQARCGRPGMTVWACALVHTAKRCVLLIASDLRPGLSYAEVYAHELAHCKGWRHD